MLNLSNSGFLSTEQLRAQAPSIFADKGIETLSRHYTHIPTSRVIDDMAKLGWGVIDGKQIKSKKSDGFQKHLVVFRNENIVITSEDGDTVYPQILLTNSHDGRSSFVFRAGLFRLVCENGLVVATQEFQNVNIRHSGYSFEDLRTQIKEMVMQLPLTVESNQWNWMKPKLKNSLLKLLRFVSLKNNSRDTFSTSTKSLSQLAKRMKVKTFGQYSMWFKRNY
jgi:hypothetical protein